MFLIALFLFSYCTEHYILFFFWHTEKKTEISSHSQNESQPHSYTQTTTEEDRDEGSKHESRKGGILSWNRAFIEYVLLYWVCLYSTLSVLSACMCILHIVFCTVCKYVLSICKLLLFFLHCLSICKLLLFFLHCLSICKLLLFFLHCLSICKLLLLFFFLHCLSICKLLLLFFFFALSVHM